AVGSPAAAKKREHHGPAGPQVAEADGPSSRIGQREVGRLLAHHGDPGHDPGGPKIVDAALHHRARLGPDARLRRLPHRVEPFTKGHEDLLQEDSSRLRYTMFS